MQKVAFLDRDGTINKDFGYVHTKDRFELIEGAQTALKSLQEMGYLLIIISNQSGIGRGYFSEQEYLEFQEYIEKYLREKGITIAASYYCPHQSEDDCDCRKPKTGLFKRAEKDYDIDWKNSIVVGDRYRDLTICKERDIRGFFIRGTETEQNIPGIVSVESLLEVAQLVE